MGSHSGCNYHVYRAAHAYSSMGDYAKWMGDFLHVEFVYVTDERIL